MKALKLNIGSGTEKVEGFLNVDAEPSTNPDILCDITKTKLPIKSGRVDEIIFFHCIEHISKRLHPHVFTEMWRVLKPGGDLFVSYPEFTKCVDNWQKNYKGMKEFWEHTLYGLQRYPSDFHVAIMHTPDFKDFLLDCGFVDIKSCPEPKDWWNTVVAAKKGQMPPKYEDLMRNHKEKVVIQRIRK
jgi:predicted SAM-dependent methyltransferase